VKDLDWSLVADVIVMQYWPIRLWPMDKHHHYIGGPEGYGVGYGAPSSDECRAEGCRLCSTTEAL
jgi:hypothetical protein